MSEFSGVFGEFATLLGKGGSFNGGLDGGYYGMNVNLFIICSRLGTDPSVHRGRLPFNFIRYSYDSR